MAFLRLFFAMGLLVLFFAAGAAFFGVAFVLVTRRRVVFLELFLPVFFLGFMMWMSYALN